LRIEGSIRTSRQWDLSTTPSGSKLNRIRHFHSELVAATLHTLAPGTALGLSGRLFPLSGDLLATFKHLHITLLEAGVTQTWGTL
jgi:hypothetical protein